MNLTETWHGAPVWVWAAGGTLATAGAVYVYRKRKLSGASGQTIVSGGDNGASDNIPSFLGGGGGGPLGNPADMFGNYTPPEPAQVPVTVPDAVPDATLNLNDHLPPSAKEVTSAIDTVIASITPKAVAPTPVAIPQPAPPPPSVSIPDNWQSIASVLGAPTGYSATPIVAQGSVVGENLWRNDIPMVTAPWQQALGLAPAEPGEVAHPIVVGGDTIGESFTGRSTVPAPYNVIDNPPPPSEIFQSIYGPVTRAQYELLPPSARL